VFFLEVGIQNDQHIQFLYSPDTLHVVPFHYPSLQPKRMKEINRWSYIGESIRRKQGIEFFFVILEENEMVRKR
jgi:hypothetical protein